MITHGTRMFLERIKCFMTEHRFIRIPLLDGNIQVMCTKCEKIFIKKRESDICEEYFNE